jgi:RNA 2',3'-cyclic 3'-phosphodiesterase
MFVALDLPERVRRDIVNWGETELADPALRRVPAESLHLTLAFLGNRPPEDVERIEEILEELVEIPIMTELGDPVGRPERGRPRLIALPALSTTCYAVERLQAELSELLVMARILEPEKRPFWPHVTVARVRAEGGGSRRPRRVEVPSGPRPTAGTGLFDAVRLSLYRSELQPSGARYVPLAQVELPGRGWQ